MNSDPLHTSIYLTLHWKKYFSSFFYLFDFQLKLGFLHSWKKYRISFRSGKVLKKENCISTLLPLFSFLHNINLEKNIFLRINVSCKLTISWQIASVLRKIQASLSLHWAPIHQLGCVKGLVWYFTLKALF